MMKKRMMTSLFVGSLAISGLLLTACQSRESSIKTTSNLKAGQMKSLVREENDNPFTALLGNNLGGLAFNVTDDVKEMLVYFDVYEKDKLVRHEEVGGVLFDDSDLFSADRTGNLVWAQYENISLNDELKKEEEGEDIHVLGPIAVASSTVDGGVSYQFDMPDLSHYSYDSSGNSRIDPAEKMRLNEPVMLNVWTKGDSLATFNEGSAYFKKENLTNEASYFLYVIFSDKVVE
ncbi:hypothetical protein [Vagococcus zengguangii]|uniref:Uncharacterized protein n=1 Tax=Vagococcus zengguangii TaxID=2571750 RepID=A0A4D7CV03_9ENTE|nr:hypothetical protein [Vagococcus zengguangii]QCI87154.1 hypothetical protein FA707_09525 [Vagococcus zengguangii]TLG80659.1 hypothetical protein FE258_04140 [Vagococcus zengguangii]